MGLKDLWENWLRTGLKTGTHMYNGFGDLRGHRFHLRVDSEEKGVLIADASKLLFLNGTAVDFVRCMLENKTDAETVKYFKGRYKKVDKSQIREHYKKVKVQVKEFVEGNLSVIENIGGNDPTIGADDLPAPYRMDLALTYKCQNKCSHCYNEPKRKKKEMGSEDWLKTIDILWGKGIPHIVFTGGEPTMSKHLMDLIVKSEENGQITGLITNGRKLREKGYLKGLVKAGLDHVQITVLSHKAGVHDKLTCSKGSWKETIAGLKVALKEDLYVMTNTTIMRSSYNEIEDTMQFLIDLGVKNIGFNCLIRSGKGKSSEGITYEELTLVLSKLKSLAAENDINLVWYSPTPYCEFNPINFGLGIKQCTACSINMAVEPDGTVLPCQSYYEPLGNILKDDWDKIWDHKLCTKIRERRYVPKKCGNCPLLDVCGGGCPLSVGRDDYICSGNS